MKIKAFVIIAIWMLGIISIPLSIIYIVKTHNLKAEVSDLQDQVRDWQICTLDVVECEYEK